MLFKEKTINIFRKIFRLLPLYCCIPASLLLYVYYICMLCILCIFCVCVIYEMLFVLIKMKLVMNTERGYWKFSFCFFFTMLFRYPAANFGPLSRVQSHSPDVHHSLIISFRPEGHWKSCNYFGFLSPAEYLVSFESGTFRFGLKALTP